MVDGRQPVLNRKSIIVRHKKSKKMKYKSEMTPHYDPQKQIKPYVSGVMFFQFISRLFRRGCEKTEIFNIFLLEIFVYI